MECLYCFTFLGGFQWTIIQLVFEDDFMASQPTPP